MAFQLRKAAREQAKIKLGLSGASGAGKTYSALLIAYGMTDDWDKIVMIDTENRSGDLYEHLGAFNKLDLTAPYSPERYIEAIHACEAAGMEVIIIDSISHEWEGQGGALEIHERLGGKYQNWSEVTPRHRSFIETILQSKCHVITCARAKVDYSMTNENGKVKVEKVGMKDVTREGFDFELTADLDLDMNHNARASKDRTGLFMGKPTFTPSIETGKLIKAWCEKGVPSDPHTEPDPVAAPRPVTSAKPAAATTTKKPADTQPLEETEAVRTTIREWCHSVGERLEANKRLYALSEVEKPHTELWFNELFAKLQAATKPAFVPEVQLEVF